MGHSWLKVAACVFVHVPPFSPWHVLQEGQLQISVDCLQTGQADTAIVQCAIVIQRRMHELFSKVY